MFEESFIRQTLSRNLTPRPWRDTCVVLVEEILQLLGANAKFVTAVGKWRVHGNEPEMRGGRIGFEMAKERDDVGNMLAALCFCHDPRLEPIAIVFRQSIAGHLI